MADTNCLGALKHYFGTGTAEAEEHILGDAFVPMNQLAELMSPPVACPRLLIGKKGSGKSAFARFLRRKLDQGSIPMLYLRPKDIPYDIEGDSHSIGSLTRIAEEALLGAIGAQLGRQLSGVISAEQNQLLRLAQEQGMRKGDMVQSALKVLGQVGQALTSIDFAKMAKGMEEGVEARLRDAIGRNLGDSGRVFYLLVDDTDQLASPNQPEHLNRIWAMILAARCIAEEFHHVKCIVTLRTEVWRRLCRDKAGQRDQVDHFRDLIFWLNPDDDHIDAIVNRRLDLAKLDLKLNLGQDHYAPFFEGRHVRIPTTEHEFRYWSDFIVTHSRNRPRDGIQLVTALIEAAQSLGASTITSDHLESAMPAFSSERVDDLEREADDECPQIREVVRSFGFVEFDAGAFKLSPNALYSHLKGVPSRCGVSLLGRVLQPHLERESVFALWQYLHEMGFICARTDDASMPRGFRHILLKNDASLVSPARWNDMQNLTWEIDPAYRDYLLSIHRERKLVKDQRSLLKSAEEAERAAGKRSHPAPRNRH